LLRNPDRKSNACLFKSNAQGCDPLTSVAMLRDRVDPRTYKIRGALIDAGQSSSEFVRLDAYHPMFGQYASAADTHAYRFYYDGRAYEFVLRHLELPNAASYARFSMRLAREGFRVLHCNSVTEHLSAGMIRWGRLPVVTEVYDLTSLYEVTNIRTLFTRKGRRLRGPRKWMLDHVIRNVLRWEREAHQQAAGLVYTSRHMLDYARSEYSISCPSVVIPNAVYGKLLPHEADPDKLSLIEGGLHLVYTGVIRDSESGHHRDICDQLDKISQGDVITHIYPIIPEPERDRVVRRLRGNNQIRWHEPLPYHELYRELGRYDAGLVLLAHHDAALLDLALPNKIFEYVAAGLPVLVSPYKPLLEFIRDYDCGQPLDQLGDAASFHPHRVPFREEFTIEHYIPELISLYDSIGR